MRLTTRGPKAAQAIAACEPFTTSGALRGEGHEPGHYVYGGQLPRELESDVRQADYIVWSYGTPIAWHAGGRWTVPNVRYSITTSRHQSTLYMVSGGAYRPVAGQIARDGAGRVPSSTGGAWS
jgi:hypothetical protein